MKRIIGLLIIALVLLAGCGSEVITGSEAIEPEPILVEPTLPEAEPEPIVEPESAQEPEVTIEEEGSKRMVYEPPEVVTTEPIFVSGSLDLSSSTPEEIVIKILYFDKDGEPAHFTLPAGHGRTYVYLWKGRISLLERTEALNAGQLPEWHKEHILLGGEQTGNVEFMIMSSEDVLVIPTSTIPPYDGDEVTVQVSIDVYMWGIPLGGAHFGEDSLSDPPTGSSLYATLQKNW